MPSKRIEFEFEGNKHSVYYERYLWIGKQTLTIDKNNVLTQTPTTLKTFIGLDQQITLEDKECRIVAVGNFLDIAVDGEFLISKKPYKTFTIYFTVVGVYLAKQEIFLSAARIS
ncbi:MAG: hypothetical protein GX802_08670 [Clostridiales bacterium]|jgi:hypothetical protein|nr:hypothetical protein [Clostridiales bacterium]